LPTSVRAHQGELQDVLGVVDRVTAASAPGSFVAHEVDDYPIGARFFGHHLLEDPIAASLKRRAMAIPSASLSTKVGLQR